MGSLKASLLIDKLSILGEKKEYTWFNENLDSDGDEVWTNSGFIIWYPVAADPVGLETRLRAA
jgi:hypothetical protein